MDTTKASRSWRSTLAAGAVLAVAACGATGTSGSPSDATPVTIMATSAVNSDLASLPQFFDVAKAYAEAVNAQGGINGHPVRITTCDNQASPNPTVTCARQAVTDKAVAVVGFAIVSPAFLKVLSDAKIPWVPGVARSPLEFSDPDSFPVTIGSSSTKIGAIALAAKTGCKTASLITNSNFVTQAEQVRDLAKAQDITIKIVTYPSNATDAAPYAAQLAGSDCLLVGDTSDQFTAQLGVAPGQSGVKFRQIIGQGTLTTELVSKNPSAWEGALICGLVPDQSTPSWAKFADAVKRYVTTDQAKHPAQQAQPTWVAMSVIGNTLRDMVSQHKELTPAGLQAALNATTSANSDGTGPTLNFTKTSPVPGSPRLFASEIAISIVRNGAVQPAFDGKYYNILPFLTGQKNTDPFFQARP
jgi:ABC-type branched-subunit amino acid transport system substrate-binding protein